MKNLIMGKGVGLEAKDVNQKQNLNKHGRKQCQTRKKLKVINNWLNSMCEIR